MEITILKGSDEIGGSCVKLKIKNRTILIDYGTPLKIDSKQIKIDDKIDAILISHPHQDHFGEIVNIDSKIPIYCGKLSMELMNATRIFTGNKKLENNFKLFQAWKSFNIGDFKITPYLVDHSAVDSYAFLIEAEENKILYSGDFRANGRKSKLFYKMINDKNLQNVDVLIMEGTMLKRNNEEFPNEESVENKIYETLQKNSQISFLISSSQNIDRLVSAYRACKKSKKIFVIDIYTAWILETMKTITSNVPNIDWKDIKVLTNFSGFYYQKLEKNGEIFKEFTKKVFKNSVTLDEIKDNPQNYFLKISPQHIQKLLKYLQIDKANIFYSQWKGYLKEEFNKTSMVNLFKNLQNNYNWIYSHTSGHANLETLKKFTTTLKPKKIIPIHTEYKEKFKDYFDNVVILNDNKSLKLEKGEIKMDFIEKLIKSIIIENRNMPKVQVEREISPILEIFIEDILNDLAKKQKLPKGKYKLIAPEFPLQTESKDNKSFNIDFLMENGKTLYFVELKTDSNSFKYKQINRYKNVIENSSPKELFNFLKQLKSEKYQNLIKFIEKKDYKNFNNFEDIKLIYIAPKTLKNKLEEKKYGEKNRKALEYVINNHYFITFNDLKNVEVNEYKDEWKIITKYISKLDKN